MPHLKEKNPQPSLHFFLLSRIHLCTCLLLRAQNDPNPEEFSFLDIQWLIQEKARICFHTSFIGHRWQLSHDKVNQAASTKTCQACLLILICKHTHIAFFKTRQAYSARLILTWRKMRVSGFCRPRLLKDQCSVCIHKMGSFSNQAMGLLHVYLILGGKNTLLWIHCGNAGKIAFICVA